MRPHPCIHSGADSCWWGGRRWSTISFLVILSSLCIIFLHQHSRPLFWGGALRWSFVDVAVSCQTLWYSSSSHQSSIVQLFWIWKLLILLHHGFHRFSQLDLDVDAVLSSLGLGSVVGAIVGLTCQTPWQHVHWSCCDGEVTWVDCWDVEMAERRDIGPALVSVILYSWSGFSEASELGHAFAQVNVLSAPTFSNLGWKFSEFQCIRGRCG